MISFPPEYSKRMSIALEGAPAMRYAARYLGTRAAIRLLSSFVCVCFIAYLVFTAGLRHDFSRVITNGGSAASGPRLENATLFMLVRNSELRTALSSIRNIEDRFNRHYHYPWTFMNDEPFTDEFKEFTRGMASGEVEYATVPEEHWSVPNRIDKKKMRQGMANLAAQWVPYGDSLSYRHMCRFNSGFFFEHEALAKYEWYWRVEPNVAYSCDFQYDPFKYMREHEKLYGFVISMREFQATIPSLWDRTKEYMNDHPQFVAVNNSLDWIVDGEKPTAEKDAGVPQFTRYNSCHFWSNFEIASLSFFRSEKYRKYFQYLDHAGGFFLERWGDAPVHSLALSIMLPKEKIHHFSDIGYVHDNSIGRCPEDRESHTSGRCLCDIQQTFEHNGDSCTPRWYELNGH